MAERVIPFQSVPRVQVLLWAYALDPPDNVNSLSAMDTTATQTTVVT